MNAVFPACAHRLSTLRLMCFLPVSSASTPLSIGDAAARQRSVFFPTMQRYEKNLKPPNRPRRSILYPPQRFFCFTFLCIFRCLFENNIIIYNIYYILLYYFLLSVFGLHFSCFSSFSLFRFIVLAYFDRLKEA